MEQGQPFDVMYEIEKDHWWYKSRLKLVTSIVGRVGYGKILDLGAGTGMLSLELQNRGYEVWALDPSPEAIGFCVKRGVKNASVGGAEKLPFSDAFFDMVLMLDVLEHISDEQAPINEINRVLKPGGRMVITVPAFKILWSKWDEKIGHYRRYTLKSFSGLFNNWKTEKLTYFNTFLFLPILLARKILKFIHTDERLKGENKIVNHILYAIFYVETKILKYIDLPFGVSCLGIFSKSL